MKDIMNELIPIITLFTFIFAFSLGYLCAQDRCRKEAIRSGVAKWEINSQTGTPSFLYLTPKVEKP